MKPLASDISSHTFGRFLAESTGLTRLRAMELFRAGSPWPIFTPDDMRKIGLLAQAKGMFIDEALEDVSRKAHDYDESMELLATYERNQSPMAALIKERTRKSLSFLDDAFEHMVKVVALTHEKGNTVVRLFVAIQRWAMAHPGWDPAAEMAILPRKVC